ERSMLLESMFERLALDERHCVVNELAVFAGGEKRDDVRMLELCGNLDLSAESRAVDAFGELRREELDDNLSAEELVGCDEHAAHSAAAHFALDVVGVRKRGF